MSEVRISQLQQVISPALTDFLVGDFAGATKRVSLSQLQNLIGGGGGGGGTGTSTAILSGNGAGGFSDVVIGSGLSFVGGTLSATGGGGGALTGTSLTITDPTGAVPSLVDMVNFNAAGQGALGVNGDTGGTINFYWQSEARGFIMATTTRFVFGTPDARTIRFRPNLTNAFDIVDTGVSAYVPMDTLDLTVGGVLGAAGNLNFTGTGNRITGDFSNATQANRVMFQTSTVNGGTNVHAIPNGTVTAGTNASGFKVEDSTSISTGNGSAGSIDMIQGTDFRFQSVARGTGTYLPITFYTGGSEKFRIAADATGTYTFGGTAPRITGDFSNATIANRVLFQTSTVNGNTGVAAIPNGTSTTASLAAFNSVDPANASYLSALSFSTEMRLDSGKTGTGTYLPMTVYAGGAERVRVATTGIVTFNNGIVETKNALAANDIDLSAGTMFTKTISGATTLTVSNVPAAGKVASFTLDLTNGGSATITWGTGFTSMKWAGGTAPTLTAAGRDVLSFFTHDGGATWSGFLVGKDVK